MLSFAPINMKLHTKTPHESRICSIDFGVKGQMSRSQCIDYGKWFMFHNCFSGTPIMWNLIQRPPLCQGCALSILGAKDRSSRSQCIDFLKWFMSHNYPHATRCGEDIVALLWFRPSISLSCFDLVNTIETKPLCASSSNLADMFTMTRGWTLLILEVRGRRWRSQLTCMEISLWTR